MKVYLVWKEKIDSWSEDGDFLVAVCSSLEKAKLYIDMPNFNQYITEEEVGGEQVESKVVYGR